MAEPLKNMLNVDVVEAMACHFKAFNCAFDSTAFVADVMVNFESLALKQRTARITETLIHYLPNDFTLAAEMILVALGPPLSNDNVSVSSGSEQGISGWSVMALADYVAVCGGDDFDLSMQMLCELTQRSSAEFAIRGFLVREPEKTLQKMREWATDRNMHVRRLASEGCRPRLPWASALVDYIRDPLPVLALLELLKDDPEEYVRRSVANNLNDIAKDHPELVVDTVTRWLKGASRERKRLIRHACRSLLKQGHQRTLTLLGFLTPQIKPLSVELSNTIVNFGSALSFQCWIESCVDDDQILMIDYVVHHQKANGQTSPKVFKWRVVSLPAHGRILLDKSHAFKMITTRRYYPGLHRLAIMVNGIVMAEAAFELSMT